MCIFKFKKNPIFSLCIYYCRTFGRAEETHIFWREREKYRITKQTKMKWKKFMAGHSMTVVDVFDVVWILEPKRHKHVKAQGAPFKTMSMLMVNICSFATSAASDSLPAPAAVLKLHLHTLKLKKNTPNTLNTLKQLVLMRSIGWRKTGIGWTFCKIKPNGWNGRQWLKCCRVSLA